MFRIVFLEYFFLRFGELKIKSLFLEKVTFSLYQKNIGAKFTHLCNALHAVSDFLNQTIYLHCVEEYCDPPEPWTL